jgi:hypothetical protein
VIRRVGERVFHRGWGGTGGIDGVGIRAGIGVDVGVRWGDREVFQTTIHPYTYPQCRFLVYLLIQVRSVPMQDSAPHLSMYDLCPEQCDKSSW